MTTRTKFQITSYTASAMMLANVFAKPLHIPQAGQWVLIAGTFGMLGLMFHFTKKMKEERRGEPPEIPGTKAEVTARRKRRNSLLLAMGLMVGLGVTAPFWMPLTGTTLGTAGDLAVGLLTTVIGCTILGIRWRKFQVKNRDVS